MKTLILLLLVFSQAALSCPEALLYRDPCPGEIKDVYYQGLSVYHDYKDQACTQPLLYDGVCPDYLLGNCAQSGACYFRDFQNKPSFGG